MRYILTASAIALAAACASPTPYEAADGPDDTGYETTQIESDAYRVTFEGNEATSRETVETYMLYRAAQLTQNSGHEYFRFVSRDVEEMIDLDTYQTVETTPGFYGYDVGYGFTGYPYYTTFPYAAGGYGAGYGTGYNAGVGLTETQVDVDDSYAAQAVIETYSARPADTEGLIDASDVIERLEDEIERPEDG